jgi:hypothetical protein
MQMATLPFGTIHSRFNAPLSDSQTWGGGIIAESFRAGSQSTPLRLDTFLAQLWFDSRCTHNQTSGRCDIACALPSQPTVLAS